MPGVQEEDGDNNPEHVGREHRDNEGEKDLVGEDGVDCEGSFLELLLDRFDRDEDRSENEVTGAGC